MTPLLALRIELRSRLRSRSDSMGSCQASLSPFLFLGLPSAATLSSNNHGVGTSDTGWHVTMQNLMDNPMNSFTAIRNQAENDDNRPQGFEF